MGKWVTTEKHSKTNNVFSFWFMLNINASLFIHEWKLMHIAWGFMCYFLCYVNSFVSKLLKCQHSRRDFGGHIKWWRLTNDPFDNCVCQRDFANVSNKCTNDVILWAPYMYVSESWRVKHNSDQYPVAQWPIVFTPEARFNVWLNVLLLDLTKL